MGERIDEIAAPTPEASGEWDCLICGGSGIVMFEGVPGIVHAKPMACACRIPADARITSACNGSPVVFYATPPDAAALSLLRERVREYFAALDTWHASFDETTPQPLLSVLDNATNALRALVSEP